MDTPRKFNIIDLYFDLSGSLENKSTDNLFPQGNYQTVLYANFRAADPLNVMGASFELANGQTIPERPMLYIGKVVNDGIEYHRWELLLPSIIATSFRRDREVPLLIEFTERELTDFIGIFDVQGDLPSNAEEGDYAFVIDNNKVYAFLEVNETLQWVEQSELETYNQVFGSDVINIMVKRAIRADKEAVDISTSDIVLKGIAKVSFEKLDKDGSNADDDIDINGVTFDYNRETDAIQGAEYDARVTAVNTAIDGKVSKSGDTMTGALGFANANANRILMGNNSITMDNDARINATSFATGNFDTDAVRYNDLADVFSVPVGSGSPSYVQTLKNNISDKFDEYVTIASIDVTWLRRDGTQPMLGNLDMGSNNIVNVGTVDGVDISDFQTNTNNHIGNTNNPHQVTKTQVGLGNVDDVKQATKEEFDNHVGDGSIHFAKGDVDKNDVGLGNVLNVEQIPKTEKGEADGVATLDTNAKVPLNQLPDSAKQQAFVVAEFNQLPTSNVLSGDKGYVTSTGDSYIWDGSEWLVLAEADWENVNLSWGNITNPPKSAANTTLQDGNVYTTTEADNKFETISNVTSLEGRVTDVENDKEDSVNIGNRQYTEENIVNDDESVTTSIDALDIEINRLEDEKEDSSNVGNRQYTEEHVVDNEETITSSIDKLDQETLRLENNKEDSANIGNRQYTEENIITNEDTITKSLDDLDIEIKRLEDDKEDSSNIGNRDYTENHVVADNETVTASIDALDIEAERLDNDKMETDASNSDVLDLKFQNQDTDDPLDVGELRLNKNLPEWQVSANTLHLVGRQLIERAVNRTGFTLGVGSPLFISGVFTPGGGPGTDRIEVELANRNNANGVFAVASCPAPNNEDGCIITQGTVRGWNTTGFNPGDKLYLTDQAGQYNVGPVGDGDVEFFVGTVIRAANDGIVKINPTRIADGLFVPKTQVGGTTEGNIPIIGEDGLILPQYLGEAYTDVFVGYGVFNDPTLESPTLLNLFPPDQWDTNADEPIANAEPFEKRTNTIYVTKNVTTNTTYRYSVLSEEFVGLAPSPVGLGTTAGTAYPGEEGQNNRNRIVAIENDYATDTSLTNHVTDTNNPHSVTKTQVGLENVDNVQQATKTEFDTHVGDFTNPHQVTKTQVGLENVQNFGIASKKQAEEGTSNTVYMTPLRTKNAILELSPPPVIATTIQAETGEDNETFMTPLRTKEAIEALVPDTVQNIDGGNALSVFSVQDIILEGGGA